MSYTAHGWTPGEVLTAAKLNSIENALAATTDWSDKGSHIVFSGWLSDNLASATNDVVHLNTIDGNNSGGWNGTYYYYNIQKSGWYHISYGIATQMSTSTWTKQIAFVSLYDNSEDIDVAADWNYNPNGYASIAYPRGSKAAHLSAGQKVRLIANPNGNPTMLGGRQYTFMTISQIRID